MTGTSKIVEVSPDDSDRLATVARLHVELLPFGPMSPFGQRFIRAVGYEQPIRNGLMQLACLEVDDEIAGFIAYAADAKRFYTSALKQSMFRIVIETLKSILRNPKRIASTIRAMRVLIARSAPVELPDATAEITAIAVRPEFGSAQFVRETGVRVSKELIDHAKQGARNLGAKQLRGVVDGFNKPTVMMFAQLGATITSFEQAGEPMFSIVLDLD